MFNRNGLNWENAQPFLTTDELSHVWSNWKTKRGISKEGSGQAKKEPVTDKKKLLAGICRLYNTKVCTSQNDAECKSSWGKSLKHVCNKYLARELVKLIWCPCAKSTEPFVSPLHEPVHLG